MIFGFLDNNFFLRVFVRILVSNLILVVCEYRLIRRLGL